MAKGMDSYRFVSGATRRVLKAWVAGEPVREIPWTPLAKPLAACTVAAISSAGVALRDDRPFDQQGEGDNPWWGDPSHRVLPRTATEADVRIDHLHIDPRPAPLGLRLGKPGDREGQTAVLRALLGALEEIREPGGVVHLPFEWQGEPPRLEPPEPPPIVQLLKRRPKRARSAAIFLGDDLPTVRAGVRAREAAPASAALACLRTACMKCHVAEEVPWFTVGTPRRHLAHMALE